MPFNDRILLKVRRDLLPKNSYGAGLDAGGSLTKTAFIHKGESEDSEFATVEMAYFHNHEFADAVEFINQHALLQTGSDTFLPATGATTTKNHDVVRRILGVADVATFNEFNCHIHGITFLVKNFEDDDFCDATLQYQADSLAGAVSDLSLEDELSTIRRTTYNYSEEQKMVNSFAADEKGRFPLLMIMAGSGNGNFIIDANNDMVMITGTFKAGKSLIGLTGTLFDIPKNHYVELCNLADKGELKSQGKKDHEPQDHYDRLNDLVEKEFPFNSADDKRENVARALVRDFAEEQAYTIALAYARTNVKNVYYGGGMALSTVMRREILAAVNRYHLDGLKVRFLKTNCTGALGALIAQHELQAEALKLAEMMKHAAAAAAAAAAAQVPQDAQATEAQPAAAAEQPSA